MTSFGRVNIYSTVDDIQVSLRAAGAGRWADRLDVALSRGATSGEILGDLALELEALVASGDSDTADCLVLACAALAGINQAFESVGQPARPLPQQCAHPTFADAD